jgi:hypothetical protein
MKGIWLQVGGRRTTLTAIYDTRSGCMKTGPVSENHKLQLQARLRSLSALEYLLSSQVPQFPQALVSSFQVKILPGAAFQTRFNSLLNPPALKKVTPLTPILKFTLATKSRT